MNNKNDSILVEEQQIKQLRTKLTNATHPAYNVRT